MWPVGLACPGQRCLECRRFIPTGRRVDVARLVSQMSPERNRDKSATVLPKVRSLAECGSERWRPNDLPTMPLGSGNDLLITHREWTAHCCRFLKKLSGTAR